MSRIPLAPSLGEYRELGSSFHARLVALSDADDLKNAMDALKKDFPRADHYPYALRLGPLSRSSDDGEPSGTAGRPLLSLLNDRDIDGAIVVARYFGGSKLGVPRLRRAFVSAAEEAISHARLGVTQTVYAYPLEVDYSLYQTILNSAKRLGIALDDVDFGVKVRLKIRSRCILDRFGEKVGQPLLALPEPMLESVIEEETL